MTLLLLAYLGGVLTIISPCILAGAAFCVRTLGAPVRQQRAANADRDGGEALASSLPSCIN